MSLIDWIYESWPRFLLFLAVYTAILYYFSPVGAVAFLVAMTIVVLIGAVRRRDGG